MKPKYNIYYILLALMVLFGCTAEEEMDSPSTGGVDEIARTEVIFNLGIPARELPSATRAITNDSHIEDFRIWIFKGTGADAAFEREIKKGDRNDEGNLLVDFKSTPNGLQQVYVLLPENGETITLSMIANTPGIPAPAAGTKKSVALAQLEYSLSDATQMPMYGEQEMIVAQGLRTSISLRRAMAKIEIDAREAFALFKLESVELLNINFRGKVAGGVITDQQNYPIQTINADSKEKNIFTFYVPEIQDVNAQAAGRMVSVLIKGKYRDDQPSFYRLEFIGREGKKIANIERNNKYVFLIEKIESSGYTERKAAIDGIASNGAGQGMEVQTVENEDIMDITTDGSHYLGVTSAKTNALSNEHYYFANFSVQGNNPDGWKMITTDFPAGVSVSMDAFKGDAEIPINTVNSVWIYIEKAKAKPGDKIAIYIYSGNIRKKIEVTIPNI